MIERVRNPRKLLELLAMNAPPDQVDSHFNPSDWLSDPRNVALSVENDLAMFEHCGPGIAMGHIWFHSRGAKAFRRAEDMLDYMAAGGVTEILGEVPAWRKGVQRFVRKLGFHAIGVALRPMGKVVVFQTANHPPARLVA